MLSLKLPQNCHRSLDCHPLDFFFPQDRENAFHLGAWEAAEGGVFVVFTKEESCWSEAGQTRGSANPQAAAEQDLALQALGLSLFW